MASGAIADLVTGPARAATVLAAGPYAAYLTFAGERGVRLALVTADAVRVPFGVRLPHVAARSPLTGVRQGQRAVVGAGTVSIGHLSVGVARWWSARPVLHPLASADLMRWREALDSATKGARSPGLPYDDEAVFAFGLALARHDAAEATRGAARLLGRGPGSTPSGDDLLAAVLAAMRIFAPAYPRAAAMWESCGKAVAESVTAIAGDRTTPLAAALLRYAVRGEPTGEVADVLRAVGRPADVVHTATRRLSAVGHTSGADCLQGLRILAAALAPSFGHAPATERSAT